MTTLLTMTLVAVLAVEPNPFAPSLPLLTDAEEERLDQVIDHFIEFDIGLLRGEEAKKAKEDFDKLGPEATFALIRGLSRAAAIDHSCPALVIARKLDRFLQISNDPELLQYAHENIGLGVKQSRHGGIIKDLKFSVSLRKGVLARAGITKYQGTPGGATGPTRTTIRPLSSMSEAELATLAGSERGSRLKRVLGELGQRKGEDALNALGAAAGGLYDEEVQQAAREALAVHLKQQSPDEVKASLKNDRVEICVAAAAAAGSRGLMGCGGELVALLDDAEPRVREAAQQALTRLNKGVNLGPAPRATDDERAAAVKKWRDWWTKQGGR